LPDNDQLGHSLRTCGISSAQGQWAITLQGYDSVLVFGKLLVDDVDDMCKSMQSVTREIAGKYNMPMRARVNLKAMVWWIRDLSARGQSIPDEGFTVDNLEQARSKCRMEKKQMIRTRSSCQESSHPGIGLDGGNL
jgi:hypothetical protein